MVEKWGAPFRGKSCLPTLKQVVRNSLIHKGTRVGVPDKTRGKASFSLSTPLLT